MAKVREIFREYVRVLRIARRPNRFEFANVSKITGFGIILIGAIGFIVRMIVQITSG
ncbi:MAG: protein translocase SEC61 complex subunit gamma [Candidatus Hydrothermarchaeota archaeon]